jgi:hypothetical protein
MWGLVEPISRVTLSASRMGFCRLFKYFRKLEKEVLLLTSPFAFGVERTQIIIWK